MTLEKAMAPHSSALAWKIAWTEKPGRLQSIGSLTTSQTGLSDFTFTFHFHTLEKEMATHSSVLAWRIPGTGAWWAAVYGVTQGQTRLKRLSSSLYHCYSGNFIGVFVSVLQEVLFLFFCFLFFKIILFIYLFLAALGLCCWQAFFSGCGEQGLLSSCGGLASHCGGFSCCRAPDLG